MRIQRVMIHNYRKMGFDEIETKIMFSLLVARDFDGSLLVRLRRPNLVIYLTIFNRYDLILRISSHKQTCILLFV